MLCCFVKIGLVILDVFKGNVRSFSNEEQENLKKISEFQKNTVSLRHKANYRISTYYEKNPLGNAFANPNCGHPCPDGV